jgi:hypothetical protein
MNAAGLFLTATGALLMYLYLRGAPRLAENASATDVKRAYERDRHLLMIGVGLIAAWCVVQYAGVLI